MKRGFYFEGLCRCKKCKALFTDVTSEDQTEITLPDGRKARMQLCDSCLIGTLPGIATEAFLQLRDKMLIELRQEKETPVPDGQGTGVAGGCQTEEAGTGGRRPSNARVNRPQYRGAKGRSPRSRKL